MEPFHAIFIRAPIVEKLLPHVPGPQISESHIDSTVIAPSRPIEDSIPNAKSILNAPVEILATLPGRTASIPDSATKENLDAEAGDIVAVRQANVFGTSFHPELTGDARIHVWWLEQVAEDVVRRRG